MELSAAAMPPVFTYPLAFFGFLAVPALVAIYLLRNRFRRHPVSSLMLWLDDRPPREGGTRVRRLQTPLLFLLELLAVVLMVLTAADPQVRAGQGVRPLVVVLDDSFSMLAGGADSPRAKGEQALRDELRRRMPYSVRFVLAGERPQVLGEQVRSAGEALDLLDGWRCRAPSSALAEALALGADLGGELALLLVVTDGAPEPGVVPEKGRLAWWAFGRPRGNVALVNASRTTRDGSDRCLFEIVNLSADPAARTLVIESGDPPRVLRRSELRLEAGETRRVILQLKAGTPAVRAKLDEDDLPLDDAVTLLPGVRRTVRVSLRLGDRGVREPLEKALRSTRLAEMTAEGPDLVISDEAEPPAGPDAWVVRVLAEKEGAAYSGPFVTDRSHPLMEGVSLRGVIWGAGKGDELPGAPVVLAGNVPLLTDTEIQAGEGAARHELRLRFRPDLSTLQDSPDWPILVWNLLNWRGAHKARLARPNVRLGEGALLTLPAARESVEVAGPGGKVRTIPVRGRQVQVAAEDVGVYEVRAGEEKYSFAANALNRDESDLSGCAAGRWGDWLDETSLRLEYRGVGWLLLLLLLAVLSLHLFLVARLGRVGL
jgi:hypothetical protein